MLKIDERDIRCTITQELERTVRELFPERIRSANEEIAIERLHAELARASIRIADAVVVCGDEIPADEATHKHEPFSELELVAIANALKLADENPAVIVKWPTRSALAKLVGCLK